MFRILQKDLDDGALGIGVLLGYAPGADPIEYLEVSRLAANAGVPTFTHARALVEQDPDTPFDGASEIVRAAGETGVRAHYCHINSTSLRHGERVLELIVKAQNAGGTISTEAYPYGAGMTAISAAFLAPERLAERGIEPSSIIYLPTGEVVADRLRLGELRDTDPSALVIVRHLSESDPLDLRLLDRFQSFAGTVVASDAMPVTSPVLSDDPYRWPIPEELMMHPRNAGTFSKVLRRYVRELDMSVIEVVARCSYLPARVLEQCVPAMSRKGRIQVGCDADIVVFDIDRVSDQATYTASTRCSTGYAFVLVGGVPVVIDDRLIPDAFPGRPVRR
jgi:N-acyl-D-aspartate/D-glutamate deacylase